MMSNCTVRIPIRPIDDASANLGPLDFPPTTLTEVRMRLIGVAILAASLVLIPRAVEAQQVLPELDDALAEVRC